MGDKLPKTTEHRQLQKVGILGRAIDYIGELETKNQEAAEKDGNYKRGEETARAARTTLAPATMPTERLLYGLP